MNEKYLEVYDYLSKIDKLGFKEYSELVTTYGTEIVHKVIEQLIDCECEFDVGKFDYYIDNVILATDNFSDKSILNIYMQDIGSLPIISQEEAAMYANEAYEIVSELRKIFDVIGCNYVKQVGIIFNSILDETQFYLKNCYDEQLIRTINQLSNRFIYVRDKLVSGNIRIVISAVKTYFRDENSFNEFIQWGNIGLMRAVENYNPAFNTRFITYAYYWVKQSIKYAFKSECSSALTISYNALMQNNSRLRAINKLNNNLGRNPTDEELSSYLGISEKRLDEVASAFQGSISLSREIVNFHANDTCITYEEMLQDRNVDIEQDVFSQILHEELIKIMNEYLDDMQKFILLNRFGFSGEILTFKQIGDIYGVSKQYIEQTQKRALVKIKRLAGRRLSDFLE